MGSALMPIEGLSLLLGSIQAQVIVKGMRRNETATDNKDYKKETVERRSYLFIYFNIYPGHPI